MGADPYASLEPGSAQPEPAPQFPEVSALRALFRGFGRVALDAAAATPSWDGSGAERPARVAIFASPRRTGLPRSHELNYVAAIGAWLVVLIVGTVMTVPDVPIMPLMAVSAVILIVVPLWFYPRSKMLWAAVEYIVLRGDPDYRPPVRRDPRARDLE